MAIFGIFLEAVPSERDGVEMLQRSRNFGLNEGADPLSASGMNAMGIQNDEKGTGWIEVVCGPMFSGKTEELIRRMKRARIAEQRVEIFKPLMEDRYDAEDVVSHDANSIPSLPVPNAQTILTHRGEVDVVGVDEAQFFPEDLPEVCDRLADQGIRVIVAGLDLDHSGKPFGPMPDLLAMAEYVTKVHAICVRTGELAHYSHRLIDEKGQVRIGGKSEYEPLSRKAFYDLVKRSRTERSQADGEE
jgi:thymidine kinase